MAKWAWRRAAMATDYGPFGEFRLRYSVISSGSLVRREVFDTVPFRDELFIDHVDTAFCVDVRRRGWHVAETDEVFLEHHIGEQFDNRGSTRFYEGARRLYFITRNSTFLLVRGAMPFSVYLVTNVPWYRSYVMRHKWRSAVPSLTILGVGVFDGLTSRLGRRAYRFIDWELGRNQPA